MRVLLAKTGHHWIASQLDEIARCVPENIDWAYDDKSFESLDEETTESLRFFYPENDRYEYTRGTIERMREISGRVGPYGMNNETLKLLLNFEWLAHTRFKSRNGPKLYRDHIIHPAVVCAIGWWFLTDDKSPPQLKCEKIASELEQQHGNIKNENNREFTSEEWYEIVQKSWILASLTHDLFYPVEFLMELTQKVETLEPELWSRQLNKKKIRTLCGSAQLGPFRNLVSFSNCCDNISSIKRSHAAGAALRLLGISTEYGNLKIKEKLIHELAAAAIFYHHSDDDGINLKRNPIGYLLALADECHEADREMITSKKMKCKLPRRQMEFISFIKTFKIAKAGDKYLIKFAQIPEGRKKTDLLEGGFDPEKYKNGKEKAFDKFNKNDANLAFECKIGVSST